MRERCQTLYGFVQEAWHILEPNQPFVLGWAVKAICDHLQAVTEGRITRLLINCPPGFAKSLLVGVLWPAWEWGPAGKPWLRYVTTSYREDLAIRDATKMRDLVRSDWFQRLWPVAMNPAQDAKTDFANMSTGRRVCCAFTSITGERGNRCIIDDPHSTKTAESEVQRAEAVRIFLESVPHRVNDPKRDAFVVIMQRLHENDVSGAILSRELGYVHLCMPMEFEFARRCETEIGFRDPRTYEGELLAPERLGPAELAMLKKSLMGYSEAGQLQQNPTAREGNLFKTALITPVDALPAKMVKWVRGWDFAASLPKPGTDPDWTAGVLLGRDEVGFIYITQVERHRERAETVEIIVKNTAKRDPPNTKIRIPQDPGQAGKSQAAAYGRALAGYPISILPVTGDKVTRATPAADQVKMGNVFILKGPWNDAFIEELRSFPAGAHDDQTDAFADAMAELCDVSSWSGMFDFMRQEAARLKTEAEGERGAIEDDALIPLIPPRGISMALGIDGAAYSMGADGVMRVHPDDAPALLRQMGWRRGEVAQGVTTDG